MPSAGKKGKKMKVEFKRLYASSLLPKKAHESDAGFDLYANLEEHFGKDMRLEIPPGKRVLIKCGFSMALPAGFEAQVRPRSGLALKNGISVVNSPGTIDSSYRAEVGVILINHGQEDFIIKHGDRIAQMVIQAIPDVEVVEVEILSEATERGMGGFGSTGL
jgi:dUTP pyrophosphatase